MQHPEEGIIHAWLDGALSATEAAELEAHVAACSECASQVAEARGLIAASSRIVSSLDAIPGGVIPAAPRKRHLWLRAGWPAAIAASLILAVIYRSQEEKAERQMARVISAASDVVPLPMVDSSIQPVPQRGIAANAAVQAPPPSAGFGATLGGRSTATDAAAPPPPPTPATPMKQQVEQAPVAARRIQEQRADSSRFGGTSKLESVVVTGATGAAAGAANRAAARAPAPAAYSPARAAADMADRAASEVLSTFVGCYEMNVSTDILPVRFALVGDSAGPGQFEVRYLDAEGRPGERIVDAVWATEGGRAVLRTISRGTILTLTKTGAAVSGESPNGPRSGRVTACRPGMVNRGS